MDSLRISGHMTAYHKALFDRIYEVSKVPKSELYRRAFDMYLILHKEELLKAGIELPTELANRDINSVMTPLPSLQNPKGKKRGN